MELTRNDLTDLAALIASEVQEKVVSELNPGRWLTLEEAKKYAKVNSINTLKRWITEGYIYGFKRTGAWIIDRESIDTWYASEQVRL